MTFDVCQVCASSTLSTSHALSHGTLLMNLHDRHYDFFPIIEAETLSHFSRY